VLLPGITYHTGEKIALRGLTVTLESKEHRESSICDGIKRNIPKRRVWDYFRLCRAFNTRHFTIKLTPLTLSSEWHL